MAESEERRRSSVFRVLPKLQLVRGKGKTRNRSREEKRMYWN